MPGIAPGIWPLRVAVGYATSQPSQTTLRSVLGTSRSGRPLVAARTPEPEAAADSRPAHGSVGGEGVGGGVKHVVLPENMQRAMRGHRAGGDHELGPQETHAVHGPCGDRVGLSAIARLTYSRVASGVGAPFATGGADTLASAGASALSRHPRRRHRAPDRGLHDPSTPRSVSGGHGTTLSRARSGRRVCGDPGHGQALGIHDVRTAPPLGPVVAIPHVGGLHHIYDRRAA